MELAVQCHERVGHGVHGVDFAPQGGRVFQTYVFEQSGENGRVERIPEAGTDKADDTHGLEVVHEGDTPCQRIGERGVYQAHPGPFEYQRQVEHVLLGRGGRSRHQGHAPEQDEDEEHVVLPEGAQCNVGVAYGGGPLDTQYQQYHGKKQGYPYGFAVEPVIVVAVYADEDDAEQPEASQDAAQIVDALEREVGALPVVAPHAEVDQGKDHDEGPYRDAVHGLPVEGVEAVPRDDVGRLHASQHKGEEEGEEEGKVAPGGNLELDVAPAGKGAYNLEKTADKREQNHQRQKVADHAQVVAHDEDSGREEQQAARLEAEQQREGHGQPRHRGIAGHHDVFGYPRQASRHLWHGRHIDSAREHIDDDDEQHEREAQRYGHEIFPYLYAAGRGNLFGRWYWCGHGFNSLLRILRSCPSAGGRYARGCSRW